MGFPIELDEGFTMAHGCLAYWYQPRSRLEDAKKTVIQPLALTPGVARRERQQIEAIGHWINRRGRNSIALIKSISPNFLGMAYCCGNRTTPPAPIAQIGLQIRWLFRAMEVPSFCLT